MSVYFFNSIYQDINKIGSAKKVWLQFIFASIWLFISIFACAETGDLTLSEPAFDSQIVVKTSAKFAGAVSSVVFRGKEYIVSRNSGALLQSASSFENLGECYNPTEAGSWEDDKIPNTSVLKAAEVVGNQLRTVNNMGFWRNPDQPYKRTCGLRPGFDHIVNTVPTSGHLLYKQLTVGLTDFPNVIEYLVTYEVPIPSNYLHGAVFDPTHFTWATFEASTGYLLKEFYGALYYDPIYGVETDPGKHQGEQDQPVILFTPDKRNAMGVYSPQLPQEGLKYGYGLWRQTNNNKWNCVFHEHNVRPGKYNYQCFIVIGTVAEVEDTMRRLAKTYGHSDSPVHLKIIEKK